MDQNSDKAPRIENRSQRLFAQIKETLFKQIMSGRWNPGEPLPSETKLAKEFDVSISTIRKAVTELEKERLVVRRQGQGTFISKFSKEDLLIMFYRFRHDDGSMAIPESKILRAKNCPASVEIARELQVSKDTPLRYIERLRYVNGQPKIHDQLYLVAERIPGLKEFENEARPEGLYLVIQQLYSININRANDRLRSIGATATIAGHLNINIGNPVLEVRRSSFDPEQRIIEFRLSHCLTDNVYYDTDFH